MIIKNAKALSSVGDVRARQPLLELAEATMQSLDSRRIISGILQLEGDILRIGTQKWDLRSKRRIYVLGAGKAANAMARALDEVLGDRISQGLVIVKRLEAGDFLPHIELVVGGHPIPNQDGLMASRRMLEIIDQAAPNDLFIGLISGGSSALMSCPLPGFRLEDEQEATEALLKSGARILEINAVRRHISATNGGRLAQKVEAKGAEMITFLISDGLGAKPTIDPAQRVVLYGTPCGPDGTTLQDARDVLAKYGLTAKLPRISEFLRHATEKDETPKKFGDRIWQFVVSRPGNACEAAKKVALERGIAPCILTTVLEGESSAAGTFLASIAREVRLNERPVPAPCLLLAGGETTTRIDGPCGEGGPAQELALGFALEIAGQGGICLCSLDTDGTDGPTSIAGGLVDGTTVARVKELNMDCYWSLSAHNSSTVLRAAGDAVCTGNTGTNLCDLNMIYISQELASGR
jgi:glycerate-2-kinase